MINQLDIEKRLRTELADDLERIDVSSRKLMASGNRNKLFFLIFLLALLAYSYLEIFFEDIGLGGDIGFAAMTIVVLLIYIYSKPQSFISGKDLNDFYKQAKNVVCQKSISIVDPRAIYKPLYKTHLSHLSMSGFFGDKFAVSKEDDGIIFNRNGSKACISELHVYKGAKKIFKGLFTVITLSSKDAEELSKVISAFKILLRDKYSFEVQTSLNSNMLYLAIALNKEFFDLAISDKKKISYESIENDLDVILCIVELVDQLTLVNLEKV